MKYKNIPEEELKGRVGKDWFSRFDHLTITGNIDFSVYPKASGVGDRRPLLWAEAKTGDYDLAAAFVQLVLTIGRARTFDRLMPPAWLGAFDGRKIAFAPWASVADVFSMNDFNWHAAPSDHASREFQLVRARIAGSLTAQATTFDYEADAAALRAFIAGPLAAPARSARLAIDRSNFYPIYLRWLDAVRPSIDVDWDKLRAAGILDSDFFLADLFVDDRNTVAIADDVAVRKELFVTFEAEGYRIAKENLDSVFDAIIAIKDKAAYQAFWARYKRPPIAAAQEWIIARRDLLVPQDIRERTGAFFTPRQWVELSQRYLAEYLGEGWQEEYYVWDCAAGTGNLLAGLTNAPNLYASTLDRADVQVMHERIEKGANLLRGNVFQFDFLNDPFIPQSRGGKLPDDLYDIINDEAKRERLVVYINPPYASVGNKLQIARLGKNKEGVALSVIYDKYWPAVGDAMRDLFAQFLVRVYMEIPGCFLANFSKLKNLQGSDFSKFRSVFRASLERLFIVPGKTFDNVRGQFPIGFFIWDTRRQKDFCSIIADVYNADGENIGVKAIGISPSDRYINRWITQYRPAQQNAIGWLQGVNRNDFQNNRMIFIVNSRSQIPYPRGVFINSANLLCAAMYFAVRMCIAPTWLNDRDQFLWPNEGWRTDSTFQSDCLAYMLFHDSNNIKSADGTNHWIPFTEMEVGARHRFRSHFMTDFMAGKLGQHGQGAPRPDLFQGQEAQAAWVPNAPLSFTPAAQAVLDAGRALWHYYHAQPGASANASYYDIREHFQGRNEKGRMNATSADAQYNELIGALRESMRFWGERIVPKVYEYGFLK